MVRGREGVLEESYLYEVNHVCVYERVKRVHTSHKFGKTNAKMVCEEMEIKIGMVPGSPS